MFFFFKQKTAYEMRISDWSSDVCSSDLVESCPRRLRRAGSVTDFVPTRLPGRPVGGSVATGGLQVELDALRQRQRVGVVDRVGLAAHVGAPRVRTRLAAAAGFLLAAAPAPDPGPGDAPVYIGQTP